MKKLYVVILAILSLMLASSCASQQENVPASSNMPVPDSNSGQVRATIVVGDTGDSVVSDKGSLKEFEMVAKQFEFMPEAVEVNQGDRVKITLTSADVIHGFAINEYSINERVVPGQPTVVEFTADKKGTFTFYCSVMCGSGHRNMRGTLIVK